MKTRIAALASTAIISGCAMTAPVAVTAQAMSQLPLSTQMLFEAGKILIQILGGGFVAWLTVKWALKRFKSEKAWERQTNALADVIAAVTEMRRVTNSWIQIAASQSEPPAEYEDRLKARYEAAKSRFEDVASVAVLILPIEISSIIEKLEDSLAEGNHQSWLEELFHDDAVIKSARSDLIENGRRLLR